MTYWLIGAGIFFGFGGFLAWAICDVGGRSDDAMGADD